MFVAAGLMLLATVVDGRPPVPDVTPDAPEDCLHWEPHALQPSSRLYHAMAYDSARRVTVLFGGYCNGDTWELDGTTWTQRAVSGPTGRAGHAMAYDAARGVTVLFGGCGNGDTWEWDGTTWTQRSTTGPSPRWLHAMAYDSTRGVTVLFGGLAGSSLKGDTWEWDGTTWTQRNMALRQTR